ncbi:MAG: 2-amino-4-hydroxy-6-hydroxymethyldihydropteridine diphosphokinase [Syntrophomonadaceae bacterium]|jgi:2-amino-4-hydroxy-6-hydroxymethyldihydropteridine diphosphokinase|nr:2-amino-4-hydroxy-6-hydroxymethyldihydropteridine diphosphokinase [Thermoanaerobacterales bacterium]NLN21988.1 2-amino-4-hydroxy-6-hydroxymethyldihydropteridine diphosphokinase [Syntrophomonadaceae bacterium]
MWWWRSGEEGAGEVSEGCHHAFIGMGSNLGDRRTFLKEASLEIGSHPQLRVIRLSSLYETEPVGYLDQGWFLNQVMEIETTLTPEELLTFLQGIENKLGRKRLIRWGPRVIDLDILLYGNRTIETPKLIIPHPRMYERGFVMIPLQEIAPDLVHPDGKTTREHLDMLMKTEKVEKIRLFQG